MIQPLGSVTFQKLNLTDVLKIDIEKKVRAMPRIVFAGVRRGTNGSEVGSCIIFASINLLYPAGPLSRPFSSR